MNYLSTEKLSKSYGPKTLFQDLTFGISRGQKVALVGRNGCGKSSLFRILAGLEPSDKGTVSFRKGLQVEFLDQSPKFPGADTVLDAVFTGDNPILKTVREYQAITAGLEVSPERMEKVMEKMESEQAWDYESRVQEILGKLGVHNLDQKMDSLSGGQMKRVALARTLVHEPDFLILDEPTNHLDTDTIEWLEEHLAASKITLILVTHDRYFLDRVCNEIFELDQGELFRYTGNYENFLERKAERHANQELEATKASNLLRKELEWLRRQPKARTTKSKAKVNMVHDLIDTSKDHYHEDNIKVNFGARRLGSKILELSYLNKAYGDLVLLDNFSYVFKRKERIGIVGPNGVGKSTFLDIITQAIPPDSGKVDTGETIFFGYYTQGGLAFKPADKVIDVIREAADSISMGTGEKLGATQVLTLFGFPPPVQNTFVENLSGGEKRRLHLLKVLMEQPNFLILDEPTNDLDLITLNTLEEFLISYTGCLLIVSHDRYFLNKLCDHLFVFEGAGNIRDFPGNYRQYREKKQEEDREKEAALKAPAKEKKKDSRVVQRSGNKLSYKEQMEWDGIEAEIEKLEEQKASLEEQINGGTTDYQKIMELSATLEKINENLDAKTERWMELSERMDG